MQKSLNKKSIRLIKDIYPTCYDLTLKPDLEAFVFSGKEIIEIVVLKSTKKITLHSKDIDIETVKVSSKQKARLDSSKARQVISSKGEEEQFAEKITYDIKNETTTFHFKKIIPKGKIKLSVVFSGIISETLRGFYKSKYNLNGEEKYIATTQFEATDARRCFPCFDEPAQKAIFEVSLIIPEKHEAISNTLPISIDKHEAGYKIVSFAPSPKMSTYLLAFIVGEFEYIEGYAKKKSTSVNKFSGPRTRGAEAVPDHENLFPDSEFINVRIFTTKGKKQQAKFALDTAIKSIEFYNEYFDIPYPLPNLDMIALPDFESAAMENWGAITYRETAILVDEEHTSLTNKQWVATVVAHEIAHQWFGNLVTMHWWTDLWLNEGFASYMEKVCTNYLFPHWKIWDLHLGSGRYKYAIDIDSLSSSHPIEVEVNHPNEINEIFDMVSYEKGTAIIRMLALYIGEDKFKVGLRHYLKKHSYKNTNTIDLWEAFEKVSKKPISKMMSSWTKQAGFPVISEIRKNGKCILSQEKFFSSRIERKKFQDKSLWQIPLIYKDINDNEKSILIDKKTFSLNDGINKLNSEESSFLKVMHSKETLNLIQKNMRENHMSIPDRIGITRDMFALAEGGYIKTSEALEFSLNFKFENEYTILSELASGLNRILNLIDDESYRDKYKSHILSIFSPLAKKVGFDKKPSDSHTDILLRSLALSMAGINGDKEIIKVIKKIFDNRIIKNIDPDIRQVVYNIIAINGTQKDWKVFYEMYKNELMGEEKERILRAMTYFKDKKIIEKNLKFIMSEDVRDQDTPHMLALSWMHKSGRDIVWRFLKDNWNTILKKYGEGGSLLTRLIPPLGNHTKKEDLKDAKKFFKKNTIPGAERTLAQAFEKLESNIAWIKDDEKDIENWLNEHC